MYRGSTNGGDYANNRAINSRMSNSYHQDYSPNRNDINLHSTNSYKRDPK